MAGPKEGPPCIMSLAEIALRPVRAHPARPARGGGRWLGAFLALTALLAGALIAAMALAIKEWTVLSSLALALAGLSALWISGGAATALVGLAQPVLARENVPDGWRPAGRTAILVLLCNEPPAALARYLSDLRRGLDTLGLGTEAEIFVLSDTSSREGIAAEDAALAPLAAAGEITLRRRAKNTGRKPGNIADWLDTHGAAFEHMAVLDADSRMSAWRLRDLIHRIDTRPRTGLLQAGMTLLPGRSRFGRHQRTSSRLLSPNFGRGMAAWAGECGNYWGHNAIMRVAAFRCAATLPRLSGPPPFGGPPLSHDFVEAAWIRRAGWAVELDPDPSGSAEDGPQTLAAFHRRDRRWCQGNLQHLRLLAAPGLDPVSRLHLASGVLSYLAAPIWLGLVALVASGAVTVSGALPLALAAGILLLPKLCAMAGWLARARTALRRRVILRAAAGELWRSTLIAPLVMVRQAGSVVSVLTGHDCGWTPGAAARRIPPPRGLPEAAVGLALVALAALSGSGTAALWVLPVALPLVAAPMIERRLDAGA
ncbi:glucans biosynthesis glucosyltransferase MdoH [Rhodosalinus sp. K401]|uniref:glucans biosynthesis glucosyltransferase MdoH n=1 Tax=Rhodosalinus sp. K401 TaxID=3239195 RepID=UPI003525F683